MVSNMASRIPARCVLLVFSFNELGPVRGESSQRNRHAECAMYGLIRNMTASPGPRGAVGNAMLEGTTAMPGCLSYVIAHDPDDPDALWITEVWDNKESHAASLALPAVKAAIANGRPLIAGFSNRTETTPIGGYGLPQGGTD